LSPAQRRSVVNMMGLLFFKDIVFVWSKLLCQPGESNDLGQSER
jgi:hypothetical protein